MSLKIIKDFVTNNPCFKQGKTMIPKGIVVHSTGCSQSNAKVFIDNWDKSTARACVHAFVDADGVYQIIPWNYRPWGCGSGPKGSANVDHIQFEICEPSGFSYGGGSRMVGYDVEKNQSYFDNVYSKAVELCATLCKEYSILPSKIICHCEAHQLGIGSNHGDVMHWFPKHNKSMDIFREDVTKKLNELSTVKKTEPEYFIVKVTTDELNIRKGPGTNYDIVGRIEDEGTYTVVSQAKGKGSKTGWGKLRSGVGWVSLDYVKRV